MVRAAVVAAFSINCSEGIPYRWVVKRSISRICMDEITGCTPR